MASSSWASWLRALANVLCLLGMAGGLRHETIVISRNLSGSAHSYVVDGATVMSAENYHDQNLVKTITVMPENKYAYLMIQVVYMDIEKERPCQDYLKICQLTKGLFAHTCSDVLLENFCGTLSELFPSNHYRVELPYIKTRNAGRGILIEWRTSQPRGYHRGFQMLVTAIYDEQYCSVVPNLFKCRDGSCLNRDLHCDGFTHCIDASDENVNCSGRNLVGPAAADCSLWHSLDCPIDQWRGRWFGLAIPMAIVMVLLVVAIFVKVRKQLCFPVPSDVGRPTRRRRRFQHGGPAVDTRVMSPDSQGYIVEPVAPSAPPAALVGYPQCDHAVMLLPPPYSPPECVRYESPIPSGVPPPLYDESFSSAYTSIYDPDKPDAACLVAPPLDEMTHSDAPSPLPNSHLMSPDYKDDTCTMYR